MLEIKNIAILGAGAMGAAYASRFYKVPGFSTTLIAKGARADKLKKNGLTVNGEKIAFSVTGPDEAKSPADLILVALKDSNLPEAAPDLKNFVGKETTIISVMNGLDSDEYLGSIYGMDKVLYCIAVGIDALRLDGEVVFTKIGRLQFGRADNTVISDQVRRCQQAFERAGIPSETPVDMIRALWWKYMINVGLNQASAVMRAPYGVFRDSAGAWAVAVTLMKEVIALAKAAKVNLSEQDIDAFFTIMSNLSPDGKTSMLQDIEAGRKTEVEAFGGKAVELGKKYGIPTPVNEVILRIIQTLEQRKA
jgi:2-dehydropantoate 2-reductase